MTGKASLADRIFWPATRLSGFTVVLLAVMAATSNNDRFQAGCLAVALVLALAWCALLGERAAHQRRATEPPDDNKQPSPHLEETRP